MSRRLTAVTQFPNPALFAENCRRLYPHESFEGACRRLLADVPQLSKADIANFAAGKNGRSETIDILCEHFNEQGAPHPDFCFAPGTPGVSAALEYYCGKYQDHWNSNLSVQAEFLRQRSALESLVAQGIASLKQMKKDPYLLRGKQAAFALNLSYVAYLPLSAAYMQRIPFGKIDDDEGYALLSRYYALMEEVREAVFELGSKHGEPAIYAMKYQLIVSKPTPRVPRYWAHEDPVHDGVAVEKFEAESRERQPHLVFAMQYGRPVPGTPFELFERLYDLRNRAMTGDRKAFEELVAIVEALPKNGDRWKALGVLAITLIRLKDPRDEPSEELKAALSDSLSLLPSFHDDEDANKTAIRAQCVLHDIENADDAETLLQQLDRIQSCDIEYTSYGAISSLRRRVGQHVHGSKWRG